MDNLIPITDRKQPLREKKSFKLIGSLLLVGVVILSGTILFFIGGEKKVDYIIPGVPYFNIWNHRGETVFSGETAAAVFSVLDYWSPGITKSAEIDNFFKIERNVTGNIGMENVKKYLELVAKGQYVVETVALKQNEIKRYINPESKTPLLVYLPISDEQPEKLLYYPVSVVIGVNEIEGKIMVHDFWLGNNREISFDELNKLWAKKSPESRNKYLVIQPKNLKENIEDINLRKIELYPARITLMKRNEKMIKNYVLGTSAQAVLNYDLASSFFSKIESELGFQDDFIPVLKVQVLARIAAIKLLNKDFIGALSYAEKAVELNHNIDKPLDNGWLDTGWSGYEYTRTNKANQGKSADPYRVLGNVYKMMGKKGKAIDAYKKALEIDPTLQIVIQSLKELQR